MFTDVKSKRCGGFHTRIGGTKRKCIDDDAEIREIKTC
jgi:hypothetical protein